MAIESTIRRRLLDVLKSLNAPVTAAEIRERAQMPQSEEIILMALKAMKRDAVIREWQPGKYVHKGYHNGAGVKDWPSPKKPEVKKVRKAPKPRSKPKQAPMVPKQITQPETKPMPDQDAIEAANTKMKFSATKQNISMELDDLERRLRPVEIGDYELKISILTRLAKLMAEDVGVVLDNICDDLAQMAGRK